MQDHAPRCPQMSGCSSCWGCPSCRSLNPCSCREDEEAATTAAAKPVRKLSMASAFYANRRPRNLDGSFTSRRFAAQAAAIGEKIRKARESNTEAES